MNERIETKPLVPVTAEELRHFARTLPYFSGDGQYRAAFIDAADEIERLKDLVGYAHMRRRKPRKKAA